MPSERFLEIERHLNYVLRVIRSGRFSTPNLAEEVGVSIPTISRIVAELTERIRNIQAKRHDGGGHYILERGRTTEKNQANEATRGKPFRSFQVERQC